VLILVERQVVTVRKMRDENTLTICAAICRRRLTPAPTTAPGLHGDQVWRLPSDLASTAQLLLPCEVQRTRDLRPTRVITRLTAIAVERWRSVQSRQVSDREPRASALPVAAAEPHVQLVQVRRAS
jgi:hypothetical protein